MVPELKLRRSSPVTPANRSIPPLRLILLELLIERSLSTYTEPPVPIVIVPDAGAADRRDRCPPLSVPPEML